MPCPWSAGSTPTDHSPTDFTRRRRVAIFHTPDADVTGDRCGASTSFTSGMDSTNPISMPSRTANSNRGVGTASLARPISWTASSGDTSASLHTSANASLCMAMNRRTSSRNRARDARRNVTSLTSAEGARQASPVRSISKFWNPPTRMNAAASTYSRYAGG